MSKKEELSECPPEIFHYTNEVGIKGIIKDQTLWATHYKFTNDSKERDFALGQMEKYMKKENEKALHDLILKSDLKALGDNYFITSFCSHQNDFTKNNGLLSQWRGYGKEQGYVLVFDTKKLYEIFNKKELFDYEYGFTGMYIVIYDENDKAR